MRTVNITLPFPTSVSVNHMYGRSRTGVHLTGKAKSYKDEVGWRLLGARAVPFEGEVVMQLKMYRPNRRYDIDGGIKILMDACQGFLYKNDRQVARLEVDLLHDKDNPRVEMKVYKKRGGSNDGAKDKRGRGVGASRAKPAGRAGSDRSRNRSASKAVGKGDHGARKGGRGSTLGSADSDK